MNCKSFQRHQTYLALSSVAAIAALSCCQTNIAAVKSTQGGEIKPEVKASAAQLGRDLATAKAGPAKGKVDSRLQTVALFPGPEQPVGIAISKSGRVFMSFPRWADPVKNTLVELKDGAVTAFPDERTNAFDGTKVSDYPPNEHLISVQAITFDECDRLWVLDPGSFNFAPNILHGPKLWAYDIESRQRVKSISFPTDVAMKLTYLNDVRFDLKRGPEGTAYITDSGAGGIIVVDLASGSSWRHLDQHVSVLPAPGLEQNSEGERLLMRKSSGEVMAPDLRSDGIALSPDGKTLYYNPVASRDVYAIETELLADRDPANETKLTAAVRKVATKPSGNDGILADAQGRILTTDFEDNAIRRVDPKDGSVETVVQDQRLLWPDTLAMHAADLYITSNQLARQPNYHDGNDQRQPPYALFKLSLADEAKTSN